MRISESRLRKIIAEEIAANAYVRTIPAIRSTLTLASSYVESLEQGDRDSSISQNLSNKAKDLQVLVKLLQKARAPEASNVATFSRLASEFVEMTNFWKTPTFLGKTQHHKELATQLARMKKVAKSIVASMAAGGYAPRLA